MISIEEFPYEGKQNKSHPMHEKILLFELKNEKFAIGYYDAVNDVFCIWQSGYMHTENMRYEERFIDGRCYNDHRCIMPKGFMRCVGLRCLSRCMLLDDVLADIEDSGMFETDINKVLENAKCLTPYLLCTKDKRIIITEKSRFGVTGDQFSAFMPTIIKKDLHHINGSIPRDKIQWVTDLKEWGSRR